MSQHPLNVPTLLSEHDIVSASPVIRGLISGEILPGLAAPLETVNVREAVEVGQVLVRGTLPVLEASEDVKTLYEADGGGGVYDVRASAYEPETDTYAHLVQENTGQLYLFRTNAEMDAAIARATDATGLAGLENLVVLADGKLAFCTTDVHGAGPNNGKLHIFNEDLTLKESALINANVMTVDMIQDSDGNLVLAVKGFGQTFAQAGGHVVKYDPADLSSALASFDAFSSTDNGAAGDGSGYKATIGEIPGGGYAVVGESYLLNVDRDLTTVLYAEGVHGGGEMSRPVVNDAGKIVLYRGSVAGDNIQVWNQDTSLAAVKHDIETLPGGATWMNQVTRPGAVMLDDSTLLVTGADSGDTENRAFAIDVNTLSIRGSSQFGGTLYSASETYILDAQSYKPTLHWSHDTSRNLLVAADDGLGTPGNVSTFNPPFPGIVPHAGSVPADDSFWIANSATESPGPIRADYRASSGSAYELDGETGLPGDPVYVGADGFPSLAAASPVLRVGTMVSTTTFKAPGAPVWKVALAAGTKDGANPTFTLPSSVAPGHGIVVFRRNAISAAVNFDSVGGGLDSVVGDTITYSSGNLPVADDVLTVLYPEA